MIPGSRRRRWRLHEQPFREAGVVHIQFHVHVPEPVGGLEHVAVQRRRCFTCLHRHLLKLRRRCRRAGGNARQRRRRQWGSRHARGRFVDGPTPPGCCCPEAALELRDGLERRPACVVQARDRGRGRHGEQPRGVREVEAPRGAAAAQGEHGGVVRARRGLGGEVGPEPQPRATLPGYAHLAHPPSRGAPAPHAAVHRVPRLPELGAPRGALLGRLRGRRGRRGPDHRLDGLLGRGCRRRRGGGGGRAGRVLVLLEPAHVHGCCCCC
ncbi:hypothetical protein BDA96_02G282700 [Sorghum bicolor]|uniref:Uncharacterized protein n=1 Tax=Sorghum bicolor TaxID=4558 RepID=A0A921UU09_SORBI|nr:hypothetical protein BDA96_02G282700 [Sorghum bicolor]